MKRFTLLMVAALFTAATGLAKDGPKQLTSLKVGQQTNIVNGQSSKAQRPVSTVALGDLLQKQTAATSLREAGVMQQQKASLLPAAPWQRRIPRKAASIVTEQPQGTYALLSRSGEAYAASFFGVLYAEVSGKVGEVVIGERNTVYVKNIISQFDTGAWIEGTLSGSTITFTLPQPVYEEGGEVYYATMMTLDTEQMTYVKDKKSQKLTFTFDMLKGSITSTEDLADGSRVVGLASEAGEWAGFADWNMALTPVTEKPATAPTTLETSDYAIAAPGVVGSMVKLGIQGSDVWVKGICENIPDAWVHGTISGDKVTFPTGQYLGADFVNGYFQYFMSATAEEITDTYYGYTYMDYTLSDAPVTFDYNAETGELTNGSCFLINAGTDAVNYSAAYNEATIQPFKEVAATPAAPVWEGIAEYGFPYFYIYNYGWGYLQFYVYPQDADGNFILPEKLSYRVWKRVNGEESVFEFSAYDYLYQEKPIMTELPFSYGDGWDIAADGVDHTIYYYAAGPEAYGLQTIYRGGGEEHTSDIVWFDTPTLFTAVQPAAATPEYLEVSADNVGSSITVSPYTGNEKRATFGNWTPQTYDVAIRLQDAALTGAHIDEITFPVQKLEGTSGYKVWLTSQLRVEKNVNVPDLVSIDVNPTATGNMTVKLPKPYLIPAEGVYVGYSVTVSEYDEEADGGPVVVVGEAKESGLYLHMSRNLLKWANLSQDAGMSAVIDVTVSGKTIADNAAVPLAGSNVYVKTGDDITVTQLISNHGAAGIKSMDIEYSINGHTYTKHFTDNVKGQFGLTTYAELSIPAIAEAGTYPLAVRVTKVNGVENAEAATVAETRVMVLNTVPKKRTLLEEYTGLWCGWCPRGFVALELLKKGYADDFVTVSYHNDDAMEILAPAEFPSPVDGFPSAWIDRGMDVDPYYGSGYKSFGVIDELQWRNAMFANADLDVSAELNEDESEIAVNASVIFPYTDANANFALEYVLVEDGMTDESWGQSNYYAGGTEDDPNLKPLCDMESTITGLVFNDVAVGVSTIGGIDKSIPQSVEADKPVQHAYIFYPDWCLNTAYEPVIQDKHQLFVVAILIDKTQGYVANAVKVPVAFSTVGIESVNVSAPAAAPQTFYNLQGQRLSRAQKGVNIIGGRKVVVRK